MTETHAPHSTKRTPPSTIQQPKLIPVVLGLKEAYGVWQKYLADFPKANRFTLGSKIDDIFLAAIEYCFLASYSASSEKLMFVDRGISRVDLLKLLLQLAWDIKALDDKRYAHLSGHLAEVGRMLGGWRRQIASKTPVREGREK
ncbi:MAG: four helix bundle protein [Patescibacteria group bacterium]|nr:four helix bundle protein [Patescibacteria group bacterium]